MWQNWNATWKRSRRGGKSPSDYADEGVERFLPAFEAYQNAYEEREAAMARERTLTEELTIAKQALADN